MSLPIYLKTDAHNREGVQRHQNITNHERVEAAEQETRQKDVHKIEQKSSFEHFWVNIMGNGYQKVPLPLVEQSMNFLVRKHTRGVFPFPLKLYLLSSIRMILSIRIYSLEIA